MTERKRCFRDLPDALEFFASCFDIRRPELALDALCRNSGNPNKSENAIDRLVESHAKYPLQFRDLDFTFPADLESFDFSDESFGEVVFHFRKAKNESGWNLSLGETKGSGLFHQADGRERCDRSE